MNEIKIGSVTVGKGHKPYFIADIAANHDGELERAFKLIELAKESGADAAKFQNFKADKIVSDIGFNRLHGQLSHQKSWSKSVFEVYQDASLSDDWTPRLKEKCDEVGIEYMTSPYDFASVDWAEPYVNAYKIGSGDISWPEMISYIAAKNKPVLLATGAASMSEVERAVDCVLAKNKQLILMQCNTNYTAEHDNFKYINLNVLRTYAEKYPGTVLGLSDHTIGYTTVLGSIALGASVIEKHFTDDNSRIGPDHKFSTTPIQWRTMVDAANDLFLAMGDGIKRIEGNEQQTSVVQKRGLYVTRGLAENEIIGENDLTPLRPRSDEGFEPAAIASLIGKRVTKAVSAGEMLMKRDVLL